MVKEFVYIDYVIFFDFEIRYILCQKILIVYD